MHWFRLLRPANILTAWADIVAGYAAAVALGGASWDAGAFPLLLLATTGLYGGGVVLNDVFDASLDSVERPERPIPSGRVARGHAALLGAALLLSGVTAAAMVGPPAGRVAAAIAGLAVLYDARAKHHSAIGPLTMGLCRAGNLLLGAAVLPGVLASIWILGALPLVYVAAITLVSRGEVHGALRGAGALALALVLAVVVGLLLVWRWTSNESIRMLLFVAAFAAAVLPAFLKAATRPDPATARAAVRAGVLCLVLLDASLAAGFAGWLPGLLTMTLLPLSMILARRFAVT